MLRLSAEGVMIENRRARRSPREGARDADETYATASAAAIGGGMTC